MKSSEFLTMIPLFEVLIISAAIAQIQRKFIQSQIHLAESLDHGPVAKGIQTVRDGVQGLQDVGSWLQKRNAFKKLTRLKRTWRASKCSLKQTVSSWTTSRLK